MYKHYANAMKSLVYLHVLTHREGHVYVWGSYFCLCASDLDFSMCFALSMNAVDIISAIEFDKTGEHLATGDRGGRVVLFERMDGRDVRSVRSPSLRAHVNVCRRMIRPVCA